MNGAIPNTISSVLRFSRIPYLLLGIGILAIPFLSSCSQPGEPAHKMLYGAIVRGDTTAPELALVFTGDEFADGGFHIIQVLSDLEMKASFFLTGRFYKNPAFEDLLKTLVKKGHYMGAHSDQHLLYCSWEDRDSLLVTPSVFQQDLLDNYKVMETFGIALEEAPYFLPPYEWYNDSIAIWTRELGLQLVNYTSGTLSHTDYTIPGSRAYRSSSEIYWSILDYESASDTGLNGFILLLHIGTAPERTDKFYLNLRELLEELRSRGYEFKRIDKLLE
jgi:peptidoglycan/xylan/chitin deacetylase (PgdA/CDA1 family)